MRKLTLFFLCVIILTALAGCVRSQTKSKAAAEAEASVKPEKAIIAEKAETAALPADKPALNYGSSMSMPSSPSDVDDQKQLPDDAADVSSPSGKTGNSAEMLYPSVAAETAVSGDKAESSESITDTALICGTREEYRRDERVVSAAPQYGSVSDSEIASVLYGQYGSSFPDGLIHMQSWRLLAREAAPGNPSAEETVYIIVYHGIYRAGEKPEELSGGIVPAAITFAANENGVYSLKEYRTPETSSAYGSDIRVFFPADAAEEALNTGKYAEALKNENLSKVSEYLNRLYSNS